MLVGISYKRLRGSAAWWLIWRRSCSTREDRPWSRGPRTIETRSDSDRVSTCDAKLDPFFFEALSTGLDTIPDSLIFPGVIKFTQYHLVKANQAEISVD